MADAGSAPENQSKGTGNIPDIQQQLATPEPSIGPDEERNKADQQRQALAESSRISAQREGSTSTPSSQGQGENSVPPNQQTPSAVEQPPAAVNIQESLFLPGSSNAEGSQGSGNAEGSQGPSNAEGSQGSSNAEGSHKKRATVSVKVPRREPRVLQDHAIDHVLRTPESDYQRILKIRPKMSDKDAERQYRIMLSLTNPNKLINKNKKRDADMAHRRASHSLRVKILLANSIRRRSEGRRTTVQRFRHGDRCRYHYGGPRVRCYGRSCFHRSDKYPYTGGILRKILLIRGRRLGGSIQGPY